MPIVSVTIPAWNGAKYIRESIESVLSQDGVETDVLVVDDISTDKTVEVARAAGARVIVNATHKGQLAGKNIGIRAARGAYWLTIDQDDRLRPGALRRLVDEMETDSSTQIVMAQLKDFCSPDTPDQARYVKPCPFRGILTGSTLFRTTVFARIGFFREDLITGDVIDLTERCKAAGVEIKKVDFVTCDRRIHLANYGRTNQADEYKDYSKLLRAKLLRRMQKPTC